MNTRIKQYRIRLFFVVALCLFCAFLFSAFPTVAKAETKTVYSDVLEDLQKDESFNPKSYPAKDSGEYSISVIQIAESTNNELFVYTYELRRGTKELNATEINMSLSESVDDTDLYTLELLSANGVFGKYKVVNFTIPQAVVRFYNISSIYRAWVEGIDDETGNDNTKNSVAFPVGQLFKAKTVNGKTVYESEKQQVVEIINPYADFLEYPEGYTGNHFWCHSHYVAFSTEYEIDELMAADVSYSYCKASRAGSLSLDGATLETKQTTKAELKGTDKGGSDPMGWGVKKYEWDKIERVSDFISDPQNKLKDETKAILKDKQWILRFIDTQVSASGGMTPVFFWTHVSDVTVLRLEFRIGVQIYNLGAVSDKVTGDEDPGNKPSPDNNGCAGFNLRDLWKYILLGIAVIIVIVLVIAFFPYIVNLVIWLIKMLIKLLIAVLKGLWLIISAPFRGIAALIRKGKGK